MATSVAKVRYRFFGRFCLRIERPPSGGEVRVDNKTDPDEALYCLDKTDAPIATNCAALRLLDALTEVPGQRVLRSKLIGAAGIQADSLNTQIGHLRRLLGDTATPKKFVERIRAEGYRFIVAVESIDDENGERAWRARGFAPVLTTGRAEAVQSFPDGEFSQVIGVPLLSAMPPDVSPVKAASPGAGIRPEFRPEQAIEARGTASKSNGARGFLSKLKSVDGKFWVIALVGCALLIALLIRRGPFSRDPVGSPGLLPPARTAEVRISVRDRVTYVWAKLRRVPPMFSDHSSRIAGEIRVNPRDGLAYVWVEPGRFIMGCTPRDFDCAPQEKPAHVVVLTKGFWIGQTEVTQSAFERVTGSNPLPQSYRGDRLPISATWPEAERYCSSAGGRLPTEAEWEYAARAGTTERVYGKLDDIAWHYFIEWRPTFRQSEPRPQAVAQKLPNAWKLYDMLGNASEWVADWYSEYPAQSTILTDPTGPFWGSYKIQRGGAIYGDPGLVSVFARSYTSGSDGFRCVGN